MIFGESPIKDLYRKVVWGPYRELLEHSPHGWEYRANRRVGELVGIAATQKREHVITNLKRAFPTPPPQGYQHIAVQAFGTHFVNQYASFAFGRINRDNWHHYLQLDGIEHIQAAKAANQGIVLMHPHMGPAQLPLCVLGALGHPVHQIGGGEVAVEKSKVGEWASQERHRLESRMQVKLHNGNGYLRGILRALKAGEVVLTACDGTGGGHEIGRRYPRNVLGQPVKVPVGGWYLAARGNARLHTLHTIRDPQAPYRYRSIIGPREAIPAVGLDELLEYGATRTAQFLTEVLTAHPGDWQFWDAFEPGGLLVEAS